MSYYNRKILSKNYSENVITKLSSYVKIRMQTSSDFFLENSFKAKKDLELVSRLHVECFDKNLSIVML